MPDATCWTLLDAATEQGNRDAFSVIVQAQADALDREDGDELACLEMLLCERDRALGNWFRANGFAF